MTYTDILHQTQEAFPFRCQECGLKCLFTHNNINQGPYSHILGKYMVSRENA